MNSSCDTQFREHLAARNEIGAAGTLLVEYAERLGWELVGFRFDLGESRLPVTRQGRFVAVEMGWDADIIGRWVDRRGALTCPVARRAARSMDSFLWDCDPESDVWRDEPLSDEQRETLRTYGECGDGAVTVPVHRPGGKTAFVSWFGRGPQNLRRRFRETYRETHLLSHAFIAHADALESNQRRRDAEVGAANLSPRELECLTWAARGKTEEDIAVILGRSRETVHFHVTNAMRKLDACNRTHAVAIACSIGMIRLY